MSKHPDIPRLIDKIQKTHSHWYWQGAHNSSNAPVSRYLGKTYYVSRIIYEHYNTVKLKSTELVIRNCGDRQCVNPSHLQIARGNTDHSDYKVLNRGVKQLFEPREIQDIRKRYRQGETQTGIARDLQVTQQSIYSIVHRLSYSWVK